MQRMGRSLQQVGNITLVETPEALREAVVAGMAHIEIRAHLDLTVLDLNIGDSDYSGDSDYPGDSDSDYSGEVMDSILGDIPATVESIRVRHFLVVPGLLQQSSHSGATNRHQSCLVHAMTSDGLQLKAEPDFTVYCRLSRASTGFHAWALQLTCAFLTCSRSACSVSLGPAVFHLNPYLPGSLYTPHNPAHA